MISLEKKFIKESFKKQSLRIYTSLCVIKDTERSQMVRTILKHHRLYMAIEIKTTRKMKRAWKGTNLRDRRRLGVDGEDEKWWLTYREGGVPRDEAFVGDINSS